MNRLLLVSRTLFSLKLTTSYIFATIINVPADIDSIQGGINLATDGDTVLIQQGTYFENINFNGKNIVVGSLFVTTGDTAYISQTIIDGTSSGTTVTFSSGEDTTAALIGLTITNGLGQNAYPGFSAGGIICDIASSPRLSYLNITDNVGSQGGGIACRYSNPVIENVFISGNSASVGGGIILYYSSTVMSKLTVTSNTALHLAGGIYCTESQLLAEELTIINNQAGNSGGGLLVVRSAVQMTETSIGNNQALFGGGLYCFQSNPIFDQLDIFENSAQNNGGGAYIIHNSQPQFINTDIHGNSAGNNGGGISCIDYSNATLSGTNVSDNSAGIGGGGIYCIYSSSLILDSNYRSNIYLNNSPPIGNDITVDNSSIFPVILDTFTVASPGHYHVVPHDQFTFDILHGKIQQVQDDLYVSPDGNNTNSGLSATDPLKTILFAQSIMLANSANPQIIHLANGVYSSTNTGEYFPIRLDDYIGLVGESKTGVIIDAENQTNAFVFGQSEGTSLSNCTIINGAAVHGGAIYCYQSNPELSSLLITSNQAVDGGGIYCNQSNPVIANLTIHNNFAINQGGGVYCENSSSLILDSNYRSNIYLNNSPPIGNDITVDSSSIFPVILDTFTVVSPGLYHVVPHYQFTFDILHGKIQQVQDDLYVSPDGNNSNSGLSAVEPLKTILFAQSIMMADSANPQIIHLANGIYSETNTGEYFPIRPDDYIGLAGEIMDSVIIDAEFQTNAFVFYLSQGSSLSNCTIINGVAEQGGGIYCNQSNPELSSLSISDNQAIDGGGMYCTASSPVLTNISVHDNYAIGNGGGIYCNQSSPELSNLSISDNQAVAGGGIYCYQSNPELSSLSITGNQAVDGGGIYCTESSPVLTNISVYDNYVSSNGGGLFMTTFSNPQLANVSIFENNAITQGGGMYCAFNAVPVMDYNNRCNIYSNIAGNQGNDLATSNLFSISVIVDTFTVLVPTNYHAYPSNKFNFNILNAVVNQVQADLHVSPQGDNTNSGLTPDEPLQTISFALAKILADYQSPHTIFLADGYYSPSAIGEQFPIHLNSYISLKGESESGVILDPEQQGSALICDISVDNTIENLTITGGLAAQGGGFASNYSNPVLSRITIVNCRATNYGGGIAGLYSDITINNLTLRGNRGRMGGGLYFRSTNSTLSNTQIIENWTRDSNNAGGGIYSFDSDLHLQNVTISENSSMENGGGIYIVSSNLKIVNSILWHDLPQEISFSETLPTSVLILAYNDILGGVAAVQPNNSNIIELDGNILTNPCFSNPGVHNYQLQAISPCIDAGTAFYIWYFDTLVNLPPESYYSYNPDMGALESEFVEIKAEINLLPQSFALHQNYPNPFNPNTTIKYDLPEAAYVQIAIYDLVGREVSILKSEMQDAGYKSAQWDATNVASGMYFYQIKAGEFVQTRKMVVLK